MATVCFYCGNTPKRHFYQCQEPETNADIYVCPSCYKSKGFARDKYAIVTTIDVRIINKPVEVGASAQKK